MAYGIDEFTQGLSASPCGSGSGSGSPKFSSLYSPFLVVSYLFPLNAHTPQFPQLTSIGSRSFKSHLRLRNRFSPGSSSTSTSPPTLSLTHAMSRSMSHCVYPVTSTGTFVSSSSGSVSAHSCALAGWPSPGWKRTKQSKYGSYGAK